MATASPAYLGATHFFLFVAVTAFIATLLWTFVYLLGIREVLTIPIHWILTVRHTISTLNRRPYSDPPLFFAGTHQHWTGHGSVLYRLHCAIGRVVLARWLYARLQHHRGCLRPVQLLGLCCGNVLPLHRAQVGHELRRGLVVHSQSKAIGTN